MSRSAPAPLAAVFLALGLLGLGFVIGYGYHAAQPTPVSPSRPTVSPTPKPQAAANAAPIAKGLRVSPDGRTLALTGVFDQSRRSGRFLIELATGHFSVAESPLGWQDYIDQWSNDGQSLLLEREKIPRPSDEATAGLYREPVAPGSPPRHGEPQLLTGELPLAGDHVTAGFWAPDGQLIVKARHETKILYAVTGGRVQYVDRSLNYYQNQVVKTHGRSIYYLVRNVSDQSPDAALYRIERGVTRRLGPVWHDMVWSYLSPDLTQIVECEQAPNGVDWQWELYAVGPGGLTLRKRAVVPGDVVAVYWSPDGKWILGACGKRLWVVGVPNLRTRQLGFRDDWNADDAAWLPNSTQLLVAAEGKVWRLAAATGKASEIWRFPDRYWK